MWGAGREQVDVLRAKPSSQLNKISLMLSIPEIKNLSDGMVVDAVEVTVDNVYDRRGNISTANGLTSVQNCELVDATGNKIRAAVWGHPDLTPLKGTKVILHSSKGGNGKFGGVSVKHGSYVAKQGPKQGQTIKTVELSVSKAGLFQHVEVYHRQEGTTPTKAIEVSGGVQNAQAGVVVSSVPSRNGQQVGNALNLAIQFMVESGMATTYTPDTIREQMPKDLYLMASDILRVSDYL